MFTEERPHLQPLPLEPFRYYRHGTRVVHLDGCVEVEAAYYSVPPGWIGQQVVVQWDDLHVRVLDPKTSGLLREHLRTRRGHHRVADADRPTRTLAKTLALLDVARKAGTPGWYAVRRGVTPTSTANTPMERVGAARAIHSVADSSKHRQPAAAKTSTSHCKGAPRRSRSVSRSYRACRFSQNCALVPR